MRSCVHLSGGSASLEGRAVRARARSGVLVEGRAEPGLLLGGEVRLDELAVDALRLEPLVDAVEHRARREDEERRGPGRDLAADGVDEVVVDADVGQRPGDGARGRSDRRAEQRDEEDETEQETPEGAAERADARGAAALTGLRLLLALLPGHRGGVVDLDELLLLER